MTTVRQQRGAATTGLGLEESHVAAVAGFVLFLATVPANLAPLPSALNQLFTAAAALMMLFLANRRSIFADSGAYVGALMVVAGLIVAHLLFTANTVGIETRQLGDAVRVILIAAPVVVGGYGVARSGNGYELLVGILAAATVSAPFVLLAPDQIDEHHVAVGQVFMVAAPLSLLAARQSKVLAVSLVSLHLLAAFASGSRGAVLGAIFGLMFACWASAVGVSRIKRGVLFIASAIFFWQFGERVVGSIFVDLLGFQDTVALRRQLRLFDLESLGADQSAAARIDIGLLDGWSRFADRPFFGWGIGASTAPLGEPHFFPHNFFVEAFLSFGIFGGVAALVLIAFVVKWAFKLARNASTVSLAGAIAASLFSIQISGSFALNRSTYFLVAVGLGVLHGHVAQERRKSSDIRLHTRR